MGVNSTFKQRSWIDRNGVAALTMILAFAIILVGTIGAPLMVDAVDFQPYGLEEMKLKIENLWVENLLPPETIVALLGPKEVVIPENILIWRQGYIPVWVDNELKWVEKKMVFMLKPENEELSLVWPEKAQENENLKIVWSEFTYSQLQSYVSTGVLENIAVEVYPYVSEMLKIELDDRLSQIKVKVLRIENYRFVDAVVEGNLWDENLRPVNADMVLEVENITILPSKNRLYVVTLEYATPPDLPIEKFENFPHCRTFVTPYAPAVQELAKQITNIKDAYSTAVNWIWVSDKTLLGEEDGWLKPEDFLTKTPTYRTNPVRGGSVSDCESQAYTLVSLLRAMGVPAENVRVAAGIVKFGNQEGGHAWVEIYIEHEWMQLEPTSGSYWDDDNQCLKEQDGRPFDYYGIYDYPALEVWGYFNDIYYCSALTGEGNAPPHWQTAGAKSEFNWLLTMLPLFTTPVALVAGIVWATRKNQKEVKN